MVKRRYKVIFLILGILIFCFGIFYYNTKDTMCFSGHLSDAISVNKNRASYYSDNSNNLSTVVSDSLIKNEKTLLPVAWLIDLRAQKFIKDDINIICGDFVDMVNIATKEILPKYTHVVSNEVFSSLEEMFAQQKSKMEAALKDEDYLNIASHASELLHFIEELEIKEESSFCMSKHVVESLGYGAFHALDNDKLSQGKAQGLLSKFIEVEIQGLSNETLMIDRNAQYVHELGLGIVCNDVPDIPFLDEWNKFQEN
jgi:hypothetical protein